MELEEAGDSTKNYEDFQHFSIHSWYKAKIIKIVSPYTSTTIRNAFFCGDEVEFS